MNFGFQESNALPPQDDIIADECPPPTAAKLPAAWLKHHKVWPASNRIDNVYGDRNLICSCPPLESYVD